jgi:hypothetical protein
MRPRHEHGERPQNQNQSPERVQLTLVAYLS